jgi:hypothetical protein
MNNNEQFVLASTIIEREVATQKERKSASVKNTSVSTSEIYHENYY